jgi:hypothetical protein
MSLPHVTADQLASISILAIVVSLGSFLIALVTLIFTALNFWRGRPRFRVTLMVARPVCWRDDIPPFLDVQVNVKNKVPIDTSVDEIRFCLATNVGDACVETEWSPEFGRKFEQEALNGHGTFRGEFRIPTTVPEGV